MKRNSSKSPNNKVQKRHSPVLTEAFGKVINKSNLTSDLKIKMKEYLDKLNQSSTRELAYNQLKNIITKYTSIEYVKIILPILISYSSAVPSQIGREYQIILIAYALSVGFIKNSDRGVLTKLLEAVACYLSDNTLNIHKACSVVVIEMFDLIVKNEPQKNGLDFIVNYFINLVEKNHAAVSNEKDNGVVNGSFAIIDDIISYVCAEKDNPNDNKNNNNEEEGKDYKNNQGSMTDCQDTLYNLLNNLIRILKIYKYKNPNLLSTISHLIDIISIETTVPAIKTIIPILLSYIYTTDSSIYLTKIESCSILSHLAINLTSDQVQNFNVEELVAALNFATKDRVLKVQVAANEALFYWKHFDNEEHNDMKPKMSRLNLLRNLSKMNKEKNTLMTPKEVREQIYDVGIGKFLRTASFIGNREEENLKSLKGLGTKKNKMGSSASSTGFKDFKLSATKMKKGKGSKDFEFCSNYDWEKNEDDQINSTNNANEMLNEKEEIKKQKKNEEEKEEGTINKENNFNNKEENEEDNQEEVEDNVKEQKIISENNEEINVEKKTLDKDENEKEYKEESKIEEDENENIVDEENEEIKNDENNNLENNGIKENHNPNLNFEHESVHADENQNNEDNELMNNLDEQSIEEFQQHNESPKDEVDSKNFQQESAKEEDIEKKEDNESQENNEQPPTNNLDKENDSSKIEHELSEKDSLIEENKEENEKEKMKKENQKEEKSHINKFEKIFDENSENILGDESINPINLIQTKKIPSKNKKQQTHIEQEQKEGKITKQKTIEVINNKDKLKFMFSTISQTLTTEMSKMASNFEDKINQRLSIVDKKITNLSNVLTIHQLQHQKKSEIKQEPTNNLKSMDTVISVDQLTQPLSLSPPVNNKIQPPIEEENENSTETEPFDDINLKISNKNNIWDTIMAYIDQGNYEEGYLTAMNTGDDFIFLKLLFITKEKCLLHIPCETGVKIISRLNAINRCFMIQNMILDFFSEFYNLNMFSLISPQEINDILQTIFEISCYEGDVGKKANYIYQKIRAKNNKI